MLRICFIGLFAVLPALPQSGGLDTLKQVDGLAGEWKGSGWMQMGPGNKREFVGTETVTKRLEGNVLVIEGKHYSKADPAALVHDALALLSWDRRANELKMYACTAQQGCRLVDAKLVDDGIEWGMKIPSGTIRYTIDLSKPGHWREIGEHSSDGSTWNKFMEMQFEKVK